MKVLVIDDKDSEIERAKVAAAEKGIEIFTLNPNQTTEFRNYSDMPQEWRLAAVKSGCSEWPLPWEAAVRYLEVDGIVSDLIWELSSMNYMESGNPKLEVQPETPYGLLVYLEAMKSGKPEVICTDAEGHAGQSAAGWILDYAYDPACVLRIERNKDWGKAFDMLASLVNVEVSS